MNPRRIFAAGAVALFGASLCGTAFADSSYQSTTQITGGSLVDAMKSMSFLSKTMRQAFAPQVTTTMVHGNQKATASKDSVEIVDLDKEEMIHIDNVKKTYSVITFAQMRQAMQSMPAKIQQAEDQAKQGQPQGPQQPSNLKLSFDVKVNNTGESKMVNGLMAQEQIITLTMTATEINPTPANGQTAPSGQDASTSSNGQAAPAAGANGQAGPTSMSYVVTADTWVAPDPPEVKEIQDFDMRMGMKMMEGVDVQAWMSQMKNSGAGMSQMFGSNPGAGDAMKQMAVEMAKIKGTRVLEVVSMGGVVPAGAASGSNGGAASQPPPPTAQDTAANTAASGMGGLSGAIAGSVLGGWHHKKSNPPPADNSSTSSTAAPASGTTTNANGTQTVVLLSTTTQKTGFSTDAVPASSFAVPAGYTMVPSPMAAGMGSQ